MALALLAPVASCSLVGASVDPLTAGSNCPVGTELCQGVCVDITSNPTQCGSCGNACKPGESCVASKCQIACPGGQIACDALCYATSNDPRHCGDCTTACKAGEVCGDSKCGSTCPLGQVNCTGSCADNQTDSKHCGACGTACGPNDECVEGKCVIACKTQLNQPITDPWGWSWDGLERAAATHQEAQTMCTGFRGRLPTTSELYRVSAVQSATVGQTIHVNPLWSLAPASPASHVRIRLSDATNVAAPDTTKTNFRCVCPPPRPNVYTGNNCFGPAGANACVTLNDEAKRHNLDIKDRAAVPKAAAIWECDFYGGHLASAQQLAEAVQQGIAGGSDVWLHTANEVRHDLEALIRWTTGQGFRFEFVPPEHLNSMSWGEPATIRPFRCIGENFAPNPLPAVAGEWPGSGRRKIEGTDVAAGTVIQAVDQCFKKGGHLPTMAELNELIVKGLPGGSGAFLWTSDQTGFDSNNFTVAVTKWTGVETTHQYGPPDMGWSYKTDSRPHRCIYYPVDATYMGPIACNGACATIPIPGAAGAKMWVDSTDRAPVATVTAAMDACRKLGGHLPSQRDMTEAIRAGLAGGTNTFLLTSDAEIGACPAACGNAINILVGIVKWTGTMPTYDDLWENTPNARSTWGWSYEARPYRCMWTNELR